ncbi:MAG: vitamin K epoxide reductase family protein [Verrucomicrobiota bacterium]
MQPAPPTAPILRIAASTTAAAICAVITWLKFSGRISSLAGCGSEGGCSQALGGQWSQLAGIPITLPALALHLGIIALSLPAIAERFQPATRQRFLSFAACTLIGAALWFIGLMIWGGRGTAWCPWCLATHAAGLISATSILRSSHSRPASLFPTAAAATLATTSLALAQIFGPAPQSHEITSTTTPPRATASSPAPDSTTPANLRQYTGSPRPPRPVSFFNGQFAFDAANLPILGSPDAPHVLVEYFDYTCGSCRDLYKDLGSLKTAHPDKFAVVLIPCPLNRSCNPNLKPNIKDHEAACDLARLALAVWKHSPASFPRFHEALLKLPLPANPAPAFELAATAVPPDTLRATIQSPEVAAFLASSTSDYASLAAQNLRMPKLLLRDSIMMHGLANSAETFVAEITRQFSLPKSPAPPK